jgi:hypothetical protein
MIITIDAEKKIQHIEYVSNVTQHNRSHDKFIGNNIHKGENTGQFYFNIRK